MSGYRKAKLSNKKGSSSRITSPSKKGRSSTGQFVTLMPRPASLSSSSVQQQPRTVSYSINAASADATTASPTPSPKRNTRNAKLTRSQAPPAVSTLNSAIEEIDKLFLHRDAGPSAAASLKRLTKDSSPVQLIKKAPNRKAKAIVKRAGWKSKVEQAQRMWELLKQLENQRKKASEKHPTKGTSLRDFAKLFGISHSGMRKWLNNKLKTLHLDPHIDTDPRGGWNRVIGDAALPLIASMVDEHQETGQYLNQAKLGEGLLIMMKSTGQLPSRLQSKITEHQLEFGPATLPAGVIPSQSTISRACTKIGVVQKTAQPKKKDQYRLTYDDDCEHGRENANRFPQRNLWVVDQSAVHGNSAPWKTLGKIGVSSYLEGEPRGPAISGMLAICADPTRRMPPAVFLEHHKQLPQLRKDGTRARNCPLPDGFPCPCLDRDVNGFSAEAIEHVLTVLWADYYEPGDAIMLDLLKAHYGPGVRKFLFSKRVTPLFLVQSTSAEVSPIEVYFASVKREYAKRALEARALKRLSNPSTKGKLNGEDMKRLFTAALVKFQPTIPDLFRHCGITASLAIPGQPIYPTKISDTSLPFGERPVGAPEPPPLAMERKMQQTPLQAAEEKNQKLLEKLQRAESALQQSRQYFYSETVGKAGAVVLQAYHAQCVGDGPTLATFGSASFPLCLVLALLRVHRVDCATALRDPAGNPLQMSAFLDETFMASELMECIKEVERQRFPDQPPAPNLSTDTLQVAADVTGVTIKLYLAAVDENVQQHQNKAAEKRDGKSEKDSKSSGSDTDDFGDDDDDGESEPEDPRKLRIYATLKPVSLEDEGWEARPATLLSMAPIQTEPSYSLRKFAKRKNNATLAKERDEDGKVKVWPVAACSIESSGIVDPFRFEPDSVDAEPGIVHLLMCTRLVNSETQVPQHRHVNLLNPLNTDQPVIATQEALEARAIRDRDWCIKQLAKSSQRTADATAGASHGTRSRVAEEARRIKVKLDALAKERSQSADNNVVDFTDKQNSQPIKAAKKRNSSSELDKAEPGIDQFNLRDVKVPWVEADKKERAVDQYSAVLTLPLENIGNSCFANASLQGLLNCTPLRMLLASLLASSSGELLKFTNKQRRQEAVFNELTKLACIPTKPNLRQQSPQAFLQACAKGNLHPVKEYLNGNNENEFMQQQDAHEFLESLLMFLSNTSMPEQVRLPFLVTQHATRSVTECLRCGRVSASSVDSASIFQISLPAPERKGEQKAVLTIHALVDRQLSCEEVELNCSTGCKASNALQRRQLSLCGYLPSGLVVMLKRTQFEGAMALKDSRSVLIEKGLDLVSYRDADLKRLPELEAAQGKPREAVLDPLDNARYLLEGIVCHHGATFVSGHYYAYVASQLDSNYFVRLSDADVPQPDETEALLNDETLQQEAYLLFYVRLEAGKSASSVQSASVSSKSSNSQSVASEFNRSAGTGATSQALSQSQSLQQSQALSEKPPHSLNSASTSVQQSGLESRHHLSSKRKEPSGVLFDTADRDSDTNEPQSKRTKLQDAVPASSTVSATSVSSSPHFLLRRSKKRRHNAILEGAAQISDDAPSPKRARLTETDAKTSGITSTDQARNNTALSLLANVAGSNLTDPASSSAAVGKTASGKATFLRRRRE